MGSTCCCFDVDDFDEHRGPNISIINNCMCLNWLTIQFLNMCAMLFRRWNMHAGHTDRATSTAFEIGDDSTFDVYHSPPRPLPYDSPGCSTLQHESLIPRHDETSSKCSEEPEPIKGNGYVEDNNCTGSKFRSCEDKGRHRQPNVDKLQRTSSEASTRMLYGFTIIEDEDVCPTCLEEYTTEDPRITMKCSHHFHLGCIYEWMERSESCPVCGKVMAFEEAS